MHRAINWSREEVLFVFSTRRFDETSMLTSTSNPPFLKEYHLKDTTMMLSPTFSSVAIRNTCRIFVEPRMGCFATLFRNLSKPRLLLSLKSSSISANRIVSLRSLMDMASAS